MTGRKQHARRWSLPILVAGMMFACSSDTTDSQVSAPPAEIVRSVLANDSIDWFDGSVDDAFADAAKASMPVFLYWGAEWCPPCHAISATLFRNEDFISRSRLFIPVYLDGDSENAQLVGEQFGVRGYPTMIVFDPQGNELTRIPGGIDVQAYASVLDLTLSEAVPVELLVGSVMSGEKKLDASECRLLAYYSWNQNLKLMDTYDPVKMLRASFDACPENMQPERSLLYMAYLDEKIDSVDSEVAESALSDADIREGRVVVSQILNSAELSRSNVISIVFGAASMTRVLTQPGTELRRAMVADFDQVLDRLAGDESVFKRERIYTSLGKLYLERLDDPEAELSDTLRAEIEMRVAWADKSTSDPFERQAVINAASNLLARAEMHEIARPLLMAELELSPQPYYFMPALADIEQAAGNEKQAIGWLKKAYDTSEGPATRFQWGFYYISGLLEMDPEDTRLIRKTTIAVIRELEDGAGIHQRPKAQLKRLEHNLETWGKENYKEDTLREIRTDVLGICGNFSEQQASMESCLSFLDSV